MVKKIRWIIASVAALFVVAALLSSCTGIVDAIDKGKQKVSGVAERAVMDATGLADMQDAMVASIVYSYAFFAGGYMPGYDDFAEGEGVVWRLTVTDEDGTESVDIERALLKRLPDRKEWWFLSYSTEDEEMVSEALLNEEYEIEVFRYRDPETGEVKEWIPEQTEEAEAADAEAAEGEDETEVEEAPGFYEGNWQDNVVGTEQVKVPAGTFTADHVVVNMEYEAETGTAEAAGADEGGQEGTTEKATASSGSAETETHEIRYEWWISEDAPGNLVKYRWTDSAEEGEFLGELVDHGTGYRSRLDSF